jgi:transposase-like protein
MIDYKNLRRIDPEAARQAVLDYLASVGGNVAATARAFGIQRSVVYDIQRRAGAGSLADRSRRPHRQPTRSPARIESRVIAAKNRTGFGNRRLSRYLAERGLDISPSTIRNILARNRDRLDPPSILRRRAEARQPARPRKEDPLAFLHRLRSYR